MSSKRRIRRNNEKKLEKKQCSGKQKFDSEATAIRAFAGFDKLKNADVTAYKCRFCGFWHYGHTPKGLQNRLTSQSGWGQPWGSEAETS